MIKFGYTYQMPKRKQTLQNFKKIKTRHYLYVKANSLLRYIVSCISTHHVIKTIAHYKKNIHNSKIL